MPPLGETTDGNCRNPEGTVLCVGDQQLATRGTRGGPTTPASSPFELLVKAGVGEVPGVDFGQAGKWMVKFYVVAPPSPSVLGGSRPSVQTALAQLVLIQPEEVADLVQ